MANKPLRSITFPGLDDTYTVAATDTTLSISGEPADAAAVGDALDSKANATGTYDDLTAGSANQLLSTTGVTDKAPYTLRATGGGAAGIGDRAVEKIVGGAVCWNQICNHAGGSGTQYGITFTNNGDGSWTLTGEATATGRKGHSTSMALSSRADHIICVTHGAEINGSDSTFECVLTSSGSLKSHVYDAGWQMRKLVAASSINTFDIRVFSGWNPGSTGVTLRPQIIDLTAMFGSAVADAVYAMEQASEGAGVAWFRAMFPASYYPYNAGELMSVQSSGKRVTSADGTVSKLYPLDSTLTLRGIPKWDSAAGAMYYDGDEYASDGTVTRRYGTRAYASGDESLSDAITDGTNTVYALATPTTETADPYTGTQWVDNWGTESFIDAGTETGRVAVPVGHETFYPTNLREKLENLPADFSSIIAPTETGTASQNYAAGDLLIMSGTLYQTTAAIASGGTITPGTNCTPTTLAALLKALNQ